MNRILFFLKLTGITLGRLCRRRMLLAGVTLLCVFLPLFLGPAAQEALSGGVDSSVTAALRRSRIAARTPRSWMVIRGIMATMATIPKASESTVPPNAVLAPIMNWSMKAAVMGPEATPPESKAMAV